MGRIPTLKYRNLTILAIALGLLAQTAAADPKSQAVQHAYPMMSLQTDLARDAETYADDKQLVEACTATGEPKNTCLCVTHVLKYELSLGEYKAAVRLYKSDDETVRASLRDNGISNEDIGTAKDVMQSLTHEEDFSERCAEARAYYRP